MDSCTGPVELLERAVSYTRGCLGEVTDDVMEWPTPCRMWNLGQLLDHMADALEAFTEASRGVVALQARPPSGTRVGVLQDLACGLLGAWGSPAAEVVLVGRARMESRLLLETGALEIAVHGWDVSQAVGSCRPLPLRLAGHLLPVAALVVTDADRGVRFDAEVPMAPDAPANDRLLGLTGRHPLVSHLSRP